jgi:hypothetical protein
VREKRERERERNIYRERINILLIGLAVDVKAIGTMELAV